MLLAVPYYPGGSLYARNPPVPKEVSPFCCFEFSHLFQPVRKTDVQQVPCVQLKIVMDFGRE